MLGGCSDREVRRHNLAFSAAFMAACWNNGSKTTLKSIVVDPETEKAEAVAEQTPEAMTAVLDAWVIATGGTLDEPKPKRRRKRRGQ